MKLEENINIKMPTGMEQVGVIKNIEYLLTPDGKWHQGTAILVKGAYEGNEEIIIAYCYQKGENTAKIPCTVRCLDEEKRECFIDTDNIRIKDNKIIVPRLRIEDEKGNSKPS